MTACDARGTCANSRAWAWQNRAPVTIIGSECVTCPVVDSRFKLEEEMPTYTYECEACGERFERFHQMSDAPVRTCPECGKRRVIRVPTGGAGVIVKRGTGDPLPCGSQSPCCGADSPCGSGSCGL